MTDYYILINQIDTSRLNIFESVIPSNRIGSNHIML